MRQQLHGLLRNGMGKAMDGSVQCRGNRLGGKVLEGSHQGMREAIQSVAVTDNRLALHLIENLTNLDGSAFPVIQERNEIRNCPLEVDVVLPERVVSVD